MDRLPLRIFFFLAIGCFVVLANQAVNEAASPSDFHDPINSKHDLIGSVPPYQSYANADSVATPKWAQVTSLGLGVWRFLLFGWTVTKFALRPVLYLLHILHSIARPITLLIQLIYHLIIGVPLGILVSLSRGLYPAYLFLGSAAVIGLLVGLVMALSSKFLLLLLPVASEKALSEAVDTMSSLHDTPSNKFIGKQRAMQSPTKRSPPSTRTIMSSQPSLQTPTIFEESEASSHEGRNDYDTDSDNGASPSKPSKDYINYKSNGPRWRVNRGPQERL